MVLNLRCRTCLCEEADTVPLKDRVIIEGYNIDVCLLDIIEECASVEIPLGDSKPQGICKTCLQHVKISYTFRMKCKQSQILLAQEFLQDEIKLECGEDLFSSDDDIPLSEMKAPGAISCPICRKCFKTLQTFLTHHESHETLFNENNRINDIKEEYALNNRRKLQDEYVCQVCSKSFIIRKYYIAHIGRHAVKSYKNLVLGATNDSKDLDSENKKNTIILKPNLDCPGNDNSLAALPNSEERSCKECETVLQSHREWKAHMQTHKFKSRKGKSRSCPECQTIFPSQTLWLAHVRTAHATYTCHQCNITSLRSIRQLKTHVARIHSDSILRSTDLKQRSCDVCGKTYVTREAMFKHKRLKHGGAEQVDDQGMSYCDYCQWSGTSAALAKHKIADHAHMRSIECAECKKMFFTNSSLRLHMLVHTGEKKHMCEVCGSSFALQSNLIIHKRVHTGEKPYKCDQCDKTFTQHSSLHVHKFTHTDKPTFSCDQCGATFFRKDSFRYHMKKHRSEDEWDKCDICDKKFKSRKLLKNHMVVHTGERNHQCSVCGKSFGRRSSLRTHMSIHTGEKPHVCLVCERGFLQKHVLRTHMKTHANKLMVCTATNDK